MSSKIEMLFSCVFDPLRTCATFSCLHKTYSSCWQTKKNLNRPKRNRIPVTKAHHHFYLFAFFGPIKQLITFPKQCRSEKIITISKNNVICIVCVRSGAYEMENENQRVVCELKIAKLKPFRLACYLRRILLMNQAVFIERNGERERNSERVAKLIISSLYYMQYFVVLEPNIY